MPAPIDAARDSAVLPCPCPAAEVLTSARIVRDSLRSASEVGSVDDCEQDNQLIIGGSCVMDMLEPRMKLFNQGYAEYSLPFIDGWVCFWDSPDSTSRFSTNTSLCLDQESLVPAVPSDCMCPPIERLEARFIRTEQTGALPPGMAKRFTASCPGEAPLLGGSCVLPERLSDRENERTNLLSIGYAKDADGNDVWECAWNNGSAVTLSPSVVATCLRPPMAGTAPEAEPTIGRLLKVEERDTLAAGTSFVQEVTCADGDFLLLGGCTIEDPEVAPPSVSIFRSGFLPVESNRPNTWQCGWNNPSTDTPTAIATALCLKPPTAP